MNNAHESGELQSLREQVAALTRRVYRLEQLLSAPTGQTASPSVEQHTAQNIQFQPAPQRPPVPVAPEAPSLIPQPVITARETPLPAVPQLAHPAPAAPARPSFNASLESRIGGQWLNRLGIVAVLVGLSYFLKLAFDNNWIGPATQVLIGLAGGLGILFWSESFRRKGYPGFAYSLKAVAFGALYLSLWAASQYYHLVPPALTFFGMVMVTLTATALSLRQNAELLAAFALVGGFLTPVLVSTGENHEVALFCYLALLDLGSVWMAALKRWPRVLLGSFAGTFALFAAWAQTYYTEAQLGTTLIFTTFFFLLYALAALRDKPPSPFANLMIVLALLNAAAYFAASYTMLEPHYRTELAWLMVVVAAFYFSLTFLLHRRGDTADRLYGPVTLALGIGFVTVAIPIKLGIYWMALGWLVEAGALFWAAHRSKRLLLRVLGAVAFLLGFVRLVFVDSDTAQPLLFNARFGLYLVAIAALALLARFALAEGGPTNQQWAATAILVMNLLALIALNFEVGDYFRPLPGHRLSSAADWRNIVTVRAFTYSAVWMLYGGVLMVVGFWKRSAFLRWQAIALLAITAAKVFFYDISELERGYRIIAFIVLGAILLAVSFFYQRNRVKVAE